MKLQWMQEIIGDGYTDEMDAAICKALGEKFVARADFNTVNTEKKTLTETIKERDSQLEQLKNSSGDAEALRQQIATLQSENKAAVEKYEAEIAAIKLNNAVESALKDAGARNAKLVMPLLTDFLADAKLGDDGKIKGLDNEIKTLMASEESNFLFNAPTANKTPIKGVVPGQATDITPDPKADAFNTRLQEARKNGNQLEAIAIKREAFEAGINLM